MNAAHRTPTLPPAPLLTPAGWLITAVWSILAGLFWFPRAAGDDWASLWIGGRLIARGDWEQAYAVTPNDFAHHGSPVWDAIVAEETSAPFAHPFVHNPGVGVAMSGISRVLSFDTSLLLITIASAFAIPVLVAAAYHFWTRATLSLPVLAAASFFVWMTVPVVISRVVGQTTPMIIAACVVAMAVATHRPWLAGVLLAAAACIKITPVVLIAGMIVLPATRRAGVRAAALLVVLIAAQLVSMPEQFRLWAQTLGGVRSAFLVAPMNATLGSVIYADYRTEEGVAIVRDVSRVLPVAGTLLLVVVVVALFAIRWLRTGVFPGRVFLALCLLGPMAVSQVLWLHYSIALVLPLVGMLVAGTRARSGWWLICGAVGMLLLLIRIDFTTTAAPSPVTVLHLVLWAAVLCLTALLPVSHPIELALTRKAGPVSALQDRVHGGGGAGYTVAP